MCVFVCVCVCVVVSLMCKKKKKKKIGLHPATTHKGSLDKANPLLNDDGAASKLKKKIYRNYYIKNFYNLKMDVGVWSNTKTCSKVRTFFFCHRRPFIETQLSTDSGCQEKG